MSTSLSDSSTTGFDLSLLRCAAGTDVGMRREENQDSFGVIKKKDFQAFFVADGMGGAQGGATASRMTISLLQQLLGTDDIKVSTDLLVAYLKEINRQIFEKGTNDAAYAGMGTTLAGLIFSSKELISVNVGDSRAYRVRHQNIEQISKDHTLLNELLKSGTLSPEDAHDHPTSHMLTRSLGPVADVEIECHCVPDLPELGDVYIVCSDGLYNYVSAEEILAVVRSNPLDDASQILINLANQRGGGDNITVVVIAVGEKKPRSRKPTLPFADLDRNEDVAGPLKEPSIDQVNAATTQDLASTPPPPVEEPRDIKAQRRALRMRQRTYGGTPRALPTLLLLGSTLIIGLVLGGLIRKISIDSISDFYVTEETLQRSSGLPAIDSSTSRDNNSLAALARQIRAEGGISQTELTRTEYQNQRSTDQINTAIERLEKQIQMLSKASASATTTNVEKITADVARLQREYSAIEANLDVASRAVTLWLSRQLAFENPTNAMESIEYVEQVAAYSSSIKEKLAAMSALSYRYRGKADQVELYPNNVTLRNDLETLRTERERLRRELQTDVRKALSSTLANAYKDYETIKLRRDMLWLDLQAAKRELDIQRVMSEGDPNKRIQLLQVLRDRLQAEKQSLAETQRQ